MNKQKRMINKMLPIIVITIITISFTTPAFAFQENIGEIKHSKVTSEESTKSHKKLKKNKRGIKMAIYDLIQKAIENKNYTEWKKLIEENQTPQNKRLSLVINENNFSRYADAKISAQNGDHTALNQLKLELGLNYKEK